MNANDIAIIVAAVLAAQKASVPYSKPVTKATPKVKAPPKPFVKSIFSAVDAGKVAANTATLTALGASPFTATYAKAALEDGTTPAPTEKLLGVSQLMGDYAKVQSLDPISKAAKGFPYKVRLDRLTNIKAA